MVVSKKVDKVSKVPTKEEMDEIELKLKGEELTNRQDILAQNNALLSGIRDDMLIKIKIFDLDEKKLAIMRANPLEYEKTQSWVDYVKELCDATLEQNALAKNLKLQEYKKTKDSVEGQNNQCKAEIKELTARIKKLRKSLKK